MKTIALAYSFFMVIGAVSFLCATSLTFPIYTDFTKNYDDLKVLFNRLIMLSAPCFIIAELLELIAAPIPKWRVQLCSMAILGQAVYLWSTVSEFYLFNSRLLYMFASLFYSFGNQLKILALIHQNRDFSRIVEKERNRFFKYSFLAVGSLLFMIGTLQVSISNDFYFTRGSGGVFNIIGGSFNVLSLLTLISTEKDQEYKDVRSSMEVASIIEES